ncbi:unnamed protein product [Arabidopsis thaliana]|uniref:Uncharacterized protein n=4 Tax=Arabidopsis TaxID=3701 RepID=A0A654FU95_ARATH|nr:uncharacterized protein AT4G30097 [Arabidopsis thaliana]KAG7617858.1 hypothetical protein ISN45_At04g031900 [Arabidopsis thaliana x Arabidopsis arenosa]KAG7622325.1 hypothetical protein ISN44_As04g031340 [Arabidopsis suecica]AEE85720.1 hypothetical protein AT4G30097 [Arabidopsis thaliana]CAA0396984.1 unnamed protein product [Arabidopsis thaliana]VYS64396.1 unnamed protein product [Arabidopsis thaliana]|eukprot:NP_001119081.1 hypothetical protein AT4G30097 [Arabidopsis thaliana]
MLVDIVERTTTRERASERIWWLRDDETLSNQIGSRPLDLTNRNNPTV